MGCVVILQGLIQQHVLNQYSLMLYASTSITDKYQVE